MKEGWKYKKLGEVCDKVSNLKWQNVPSNSVYSYVDLTAVDRDSFNITNTQSINRENAPSRAKQIIKQNDVLFGTTRPTLRRVCVVEDKNDGDICSTGFCVLRPKSEIVSSKWVFYQLMAEKYYAYIEPLQSGATYPAVTDAVVKSYIIPIPPISEQQHIVEELDLLSSIIEKKKVQLKELDNLAQSLFYEMFGDPITNDKGWEVMTLEAISHLITDGSHYSPKDDAKGVIPMLSVKDMRQTHFSYETCKWIGKVEYNKLVANGCKPLKDDVLIAKDGSFFKYIFVLTQEREQAILSSIAILRPKVSLVNPYYVARYLSTKEIFSKVEREYLTGTAIKRVILKGIRKMPIILPPLSLQQQFASKIEAIEHQKELIQKSIKEVETLFNSRMDYYFN